MNASESPHLRDLPAVAGRAIAQLIDDAQRTLGDRLRSVVLYGSAAEGRLRTTSDVNVLMVLADFDPSSAVGLREPLQAARAAARVRVMLLIESELEAASRAFAVKFADILRRRRVIHGADPFATLTIPPRLLSFRLQQTLLNLTLRIREAYAREGDRDERLAVLVAEAAGPLRASAAALLELEGRSAVSPKAALEQLASDEQDDDIRNAVALLSEARSAGALPAGAAGPALLALQKLAGRMRDRAAQHGAS